jgi:hypothetical protein
MSIFRGSRGGGTDGRRRVDLSPEWALYFHPELSPEIDGHSANGESFGLTPCSNEENRFTMWRLVSPARGFRVHTAPTRVRPKSEYRTGQEGMVYRVRLPVQQGGIADTPSNNSRVNTVLRPDLSSQSVGSGMANLVFPAKGRHGDN